MLVDPHQVPDSVLDALAEHRPAGAIFTPDKWRPAMAAALSEWEAQQDRPAAPHEHHWEKTGVKHVKFLVDLTQVLHMCSGCGEVKTVQLNGTWSLAEVRNGQR